MNIPMLFLTLTLTLASLACLETTVAIKSEPAAPTQTAIADEPDSGAVFELIENRQSEIVNQKCAIVTAIQSLHLRAEPSEQSIVVGYLSHGETVTIITIGADWWNITSSPGLSGYSKADYLQVIPCNQP